MYTARFIQHAMAGWNPVVFKRVRGGNFGSPRRVARELGRRYAKQPSKFFQTSRQCHFKFNIWMRMHLEIQTGWKNHDL
eukprot:scaffold34637_cov187-Amphora_coffeaeformis.AAC.4